MLNILEIVQCSLSLYDHFLNTRVEVRDFFDVFKENWRHYNPLLKFPDLHYSNNEFDQKL